MHESGELIVSCCDGNPLPDLLHAGLVTDSRDVLSDVFFGSCDHDVIGH